MKRTVKRRRKSILNPSPKCRQDSLQEGSERIDASIKMHDDHQVHLKDNIKESDSLNKPSQPIISSQVNSQDKSNFSDNSITNPENLPAFSNRKNQHEPKGSALPSAARILSSLVMQGSSIMSKEKGRFSSNRATTASLDKQKHSWRHQPIDSSAICNQIKNANSSTYNQTNSNLCSYSYNPSLNASLYQSHNSSCYVSQNESNFTTIGNSEREDNPKDIENSNWSRKLNQNDFNQISNLLGVQKARSLRNQNRNEANDLSRNTGKPLKILPATGNVACCVFPTTASTSPEQKVKGANDKKYRREKEEEGRDISQENASNHQYYQEHLRQSCFSGSLNLTGQQQQTNGKTQRNQQTFLNSEGVICIGRKNSIQSTNKMSLFESLLMRKHKQFLSISNNNNGNKISFPNNSITQNKTTNQSTLCSSRFYQSLLAKEATNNNQSNRYMHPQQQNGSAQLVINMKKIVPYREHKLKESLPLTRLHTNPDRQQQDSTKIVNAVVASNACCQSTPRLQGMQNNINICNDGGSQIILEHSDTPRNHSNNGSNSNLLKRQALVESFTSNVIQSFRNRGYVKARGQSNEHTIPENLRNAVDPLSHLTNMTCSINLSNNRNKSRMTVYDSKNESQQSSETACRILEQRPKTTEISRRDLGTTQQHFGLLIQSQRARLRQSINSLQENQKNQSKFTRSQPFEDNQLTTSSGSVIGMHTSSNLLEISTDESIQAKQASNYVAELARKQISRSMIGIEYGPWCQDEDEEQEKQQQQQFKGKLHDLNVLCYEKMQS